MCWAGGIAGSDNQTAIEVVSGRPLAAALQEVQARYGWVVTYEDSFYEFKDDVADVTASVRRDGKSEPKVFVPLDRLLHFSFQNANLAQPQEVLMSLLDTYHASGNSDGFRLLRQGSTYHVVPTISRNAKGAFVKRQSRLDVRITLPEVERSTYSTLDAIVNEVNRISGTRLGMGTVPINLLMQTKARVGASNEVARDVLVRALAATGSPVSWRLFCQPFHPDDFCALNLAVVRVAE